MDNTSPGETIIDQRALTVSVIVTASDHYNSLNIEARDTFDHIMKSLNDRIEY